MKKLIVKIKEFIDNIKFEKSIKKNDKRCARDCGLTLKEYYKMLQEEERIFNEEEKRILSNK